MALFTAYGVNVPSQAMECRRRHSSRSRTVFPPSLLPLKGILVQIAVLPGGQCLSQLATCEDNKDTQRNLLFDRQR